MDDTFAVLEREETDQFLQHLNSLDPNIKFTQENLTSNSLPFLDCLVTINDDGSLSTSVYRKPTHTDQYLQFDSHHPLIHKLGVIRTLEHRANVVISETAEREKEKAHIKSSLRKCGYPEWAFQKEGWGGGVQGTDRLITRTKVTRDRDGQQEQTSRSLM